MTTFRKSKKVGPFRVTLTPKGVSTSVGVKGARVSMNSRGEVRRTVSIPGTGIYDTKKIGGPSKAKSRPTRETPTLVESPEATVAQLIIDLPQDQQAALYEAFLADPDGTVASVCASLAQAQYPPHIIEQLTPAIWSYLHRWTRAAA